jgi:hypothetical protein
MDRSKKISYLNQKFVIEKESVELNESQLYYDEEEIPFRIICERIQKNKPILTSEDKQLIDEIGESLWTGGYGPGRMKTKYWKDIVG